MTILLTVRQTADIFNVVFNQPDYSRSVFHLSESAPTLLRLAGSLKLELMRGLPADVTSPLFTFTGMDDELTTFICMCLLHPVQAQRAANFLSLQLHHPLLVACLESWLRQFHATAPDFQLRWQQCWHVLAARCTFPYEWNDLSDLR